jgi:xanthine dehydrogenase accessory factor
VQPVDHVPAAWWDAVATRRPVALVTDLDAVGHGAVVDLVHADLDTGRSRGAVEDRDGRRVLVEVSIPVTHLVVVGTAALGDELVDLANWLHWTAVRRDPEAARAELATLGPRDGLVVLDHGLAATGPLLGDALRAPVGYVGALGSRRTQERRAEHLRGLGVDDTVRARLHGPAGLDLGPTTAREIALAILAELTATRAGRAGQPLRETTERIMR